MAKLVKYIFIPILFVFLMSHNANALDLNINLNEYENMNFDVTQNYYDYKIYNTNGTLNHQCLSTFNCTVGNNQQIRVAATHDSFPLKAGDIIVYNLALYSPYEWHHIDNLQFRALAPGYGVSTLYFHEVSDFSSEGDSIVSPYGTTQSVIAPSGYFISNLYEVALVATVNGNRQLGSFNQNTVDITVNMGNTTSNDVLVVAVTGFTVYRYSGSNVNKEQAQATQDAADDSETAGSSSSSSSQQGTASLISTIGSAVSVITSASPTNCLLNGNMGNLDVGQIDLCANPVPTFVQVIGSIILILMVVPLCITLFNRFIGLFRSFQS